VELVCKEQKGRTLEQMVTALVAAFLDAKMKDAKTSVALYSVSSDVDGARIVQQMAVRTNKAIVLMLANAREPLTTDPQLMASVLQGTMAGVSRRMLESGALEKQFDAMRRELIILACSYVEACSARPSSNGTRPG
jgi:Tetracyclin repressor-like, C-terminal domain